MFKKDFEYIGSLINEYNMRVDTHPDEFNVINSVNPAVVESTKTILNIHVDWFEEMHYDKGKMVLHVGGATGGKEAGMERFIHNFSTYPERVKNKVILENDDKTYTEAETLKLCKALNIPMVLDVHHHNCNNNGENINDIWAEIVNTWNNQPLPPKIHFSSPREGKFDRKHADYINSEEFMKFINSAKELHRDFDVMLECKEKDIALFKLVDDIKEYYHWIDETTFEV